MVGRPPTVPFGLLCVVMPPSVLGCAVGGSELSYAELSVVAGRVRLFVGTPTPGRADGDGGTLDGGTLDMPNGVAPYGVGVDVGAPGAGRGAVDDAHAAAGRRRQPDAAAPGVAVCAQAEELATTTRMKKSRRIAIPRFRSA